jgi:hypothetical protein
MGTPSDRFVIGHRHRSAERARAVCAIVLVTTLLLASSHATDETRNDIWPEVNVYKQLNETYRLHFLGAFIKARDIAYSDGQFGVHLDIGMAPIVRRHSRCPTDSCSWTGIAATCG